MGVHDTTRARLLEAAGEEFAEKGFERARVRDICDRAGANLAAVNYHFGDKDKLYVEVVLDAHRCGLATEGAEAEAASEAEVSPGRALEEFIRQFLCRVLSIDNPDDWRNRLMLREMLEPSRASEVLIRESIEPKFRRLKGILGHVCPEADERRLSALAFSVIGQCLHYKMARRIGEKLMGADEFRSMDLDYLTEHISGFCRAALGLAPTIDGSGAPGPGT